MAVQLVQLPTFFGIMNARNSILAQQAALNTVSHNIANANTPGYSRQRVDIGQASPYTMPTLQSSGQVLQVGQGAQIDGITRTHDNFLDNQIRLQENIFGFQSVVDDILRQAEGFLTEPGTDGVNTAMAEFFEAAQALSVSPHSIANRVAFIEEAKNMLGVFQEQAQQLQNLRTNVTGDPAIPGSVDTSLVAIAVESINTKLTDIANLNEQINIVNASGASPNDLLDRRDQLLQEVSELVNINVTHNANLTVDVSIGNTLLVDSVNLVESLQAVANPGPVPTSLDVPALIQEVSTGTDISASITSGQLDGYLKMGSNDTDTTTIRGILVTMDTLFDEIATQVNALQAAGRDLNGNIPVPPNDEIFQLTPGPDLSIFNYSVNAVFDTNPDLIAAADGTGPFAGVGDGRNALAMASLASQTFAALGNTTMTDFFNSQLASLGIDASSASDRVDSVGLSIGQLEQRRQSLQGVSVEEEMVDMLRFQRAFEASARVLTTMDEVIDTIINRMG